jgi:hypothetical protein
MPAVSEQNIDMDYFYFALIILALIAIFFFLMRLDNKTKNNYKTDAYNLLDDSCPDPKKVKDCIRGLRLYSGRIKKDKEAKELIGLLLDKHGHVFD